MYKVVLVEDEDLIRRGLMFKMDWTSVDCVVAGEASGGAEGLRLIEELRPDIVITDVRMPDMSGLDMLRVSMPAFGHAAIIISGYSEFDYAREAIHLGVTEYLLKPVDFDELKLSIDKITSRKRQEADWKKRSGDAGRELPLPDPCGIKNEYARKMLLYIKEHYAEKISIMDLSAEYDISSTHLNAKFKAETGYTFHDFLNYYRISRAVELQNTTALKLYEIAERVGISDYKYFSKVYKKYVGYPPVKMYEER